VVATAIVAAIGNGAAFGKGREFAAWLGVVPRQYSTGGKPRLLSISKRGNIYLRKLLIHGARAAVGRMKRDGLSVGAWLDRLDARAHKNVVVVAMANKLARTAWRYSPAVTTTDRRPCQHKQCGKDACGGPYILVTWVITDEKPTCRCSNFGTFGEPFSPQTDPRSDAWLVEGAWCASKDKE